MKLILVVDDEVILREYLTELLELEDYEAIGVSGLDEARKELAARRPDMILCDLFLGSETGMDLLAQLQESNQADIPFLLMSAELTAEMKAKATALGARAFISKPYENFELLDTIQKMI